MDNRKIYYAMDFIPIIDKVALNCMMTPVLDGKKTDGTQMTMSEMANKNAMIAWHNDGIRELRQMLIEDLMAEVDKDE